MITPVLCCIVSSLFPSYLIRTFFFFFFATIYFMGIGCLELAKNTRVALVQNFALACFLCSESLFSLLYLGNFICLSILTQTWLPSTAPRPLLLTCYSHDNLGRWSCSGLPECKEPSSALHQRFYSSDF